MHRFGAYGFRPGNTRNSRTAPTSPTTPITRPTTPTDESSNNTSTTPSGVEVRGMCTSVCGEAGGKDCSKTVPIILSMKNSDLTIQGYCILDDHCKYSLIDERVIELFGLDLPEVDCILKCASEKMQMPFKGKLVPDMLVQGLNCVDIIELPVNLIACPQIADTRSEVASAAIVRANPCISRYADKFPETLPEGDVILLLGRNCPRSMKSSCLTEYSPYVYETPLGYALVGNACPHTQDPDSIRSHSLTSIPVLRTEVSEINVNFTFPEKSSVDIFHKSPFDEETGFSQEDKIFLSIMQNGVSLTSAGNIELPLPLNETPVTDNEKAVYQRTLNMTNKLLKNQGKLELCVQHMKENLDKGFIEQSPQMKTNNLKRLNLSSLSNTQKRANLELFLMPRVNTQVKALMITFTKDPI